MPQLNLTAKTKEERLIKAYLEANASETLAEKINNGVQIPKDGKTLINKKTLAGFMRFACDEARKQAEKGANSACIDDQTVYGWAVHYFEENSIEGTLYNADGIEYKIQPNIATKAPAVKYSPPKPQPKPQLSMFDMLENSDSSGICGAQSEDEPSDEDEEVVEQNVDPETGEILSEEEMRAFDGDIDETIPTVSDIIGDKPPECRNDPALEKEIAAVMDDKQSQNGAPMPEDEDDFDISAFDTEAVAILSEIFGDEAEELRKRGGDKGEYGATTGRPRRVGWFDCVATKYGCMLQGATSVVMTNIDALGYLDKIPVCTGYEVDGEIITDFPCTPKLNRAKPVLTVLDGWKQDVRGIKNYNDLPENCRRYIEFLEEQIGFPIKMVSNGPKRSEIIVR